MSWDPDFRGAITGALLDQEFAAVNLGVGVGGVSADILNPFFPHSHLQLFFSYIIWGLVVGISNTNSDNIGKRSVPMADDLAKDDWESIYWRTGFVEDVDDIQPRTSVQLTSTEFLAALDDTLTFAASTKQFVVNLVTVRGFYKLFLPPFGRAETELYDPYLLKILNIC